MAETPEQDNPELLVLNPAALRVLQAQAAELQVIRCSLRQQTEFNKHAAAGLLALAQVLVDAGLVTKAAYAQMLTRRLAFVDQQAAATRDAVARDKSS